MHQAFFDLAAKVRPSDDFLSGIAALFEADAAQRFPVEHLWQEVILLCRRQPGEAATDIRQLPGLL